MIRYLGLDDFVETAAAVLDLPEETVIKMGRLDLAESALHAPQAGWGEDEFCLRNRNEYLPPADDDPDGEETFRRMLTTAGASTEDLEATEAEAAGWIADRLRPRAVD